MDTQRICDRLVVKGTGRTGKVLSGLRAFIGKSCSLEMWPARPLPIWDSVISRSYIRLNGGDLREEYDKCREKRKGR